MPSLAILWPVAMAALAYSPEPGAPIQTQILPDSAHEFAQVMAPRIVQVLPRSMKLNQTGLISRLLVLPFGDARAGGRVTLATANTPKEIQGSLLQALAAEGKSKFVVVGPAELKSILLKEGVDVTALNQDDPGATARVLDKLGISAAVFGVFTDHHTTSTVRMTIISADEARSKVIEGRAGPGLISRLGDVRSRAFMESRFRVEVLLIEPGSGGNAAEVVRTPLPLKQLVPRSGPTIETPSEGDTFKHAYVVEVDRSHRGKQVAIRVVNLAKGRPGAMVNTPEKEPRRVQTLAVRVEGVDTLSHQVDGEARLVSLAPERCRRWVLSGPGDVLVPDQARPGGYRIERGGRRGDHSVIEIPGFQMGPSTNLPFILTVPRESFANQLGINSELGIVTIHTYPEIMEGDRPFAESLGGVGFATGSPIEHPTFPVKIKTYDQAEEVFHLLFIEKDRAEEIVGSDRLVAVPVTE